MSASMQDDLNHSRCFYRNTMYNLCTKFLFKSDTVSNVIQAVQTHSPHNKLRASYTGQHLLTGLPRRVGGFMAMFCSPPILICEW